MKTASLLLTLFISLHLVSHAAQTKGHIHLVDSNYAVIPYTASEFAPFKNAKPATLSAAEIRQIEKLTNTAIDAYNSNDKWEQIDKQYKIQLVPVINAKGEKEVWVNCLCYTVGINWRKSLANVDDGGSCFFNLKINLSKAQYYELEVNGLA